MAALLVLVASAAALLALGAVARAAPRTAPLLQAAVCLLGLAAALLARGVAVLEAGPSFAIDGLSAALVAALFLLGASGAAPRRPVLLGALAASLLAADSLTLLAALAAAMLAARSRRRAVVPLAALAIALLALGWHGALPEVRFAALRSLPPEGLRAALVLVASLAAAASLPLALPAIPGALTAFYLLARLLLDLPGPITPAWWAAPTLVLGTAGALTLARRAAAADDLAAATASTGAAITALAGAAVGVALLARGADLLPLAASALAAALLLVLAWSVWGSLLLLTSGTIEATVGTTALSRLGGLLRRTPATGLALLIALASMAALPLSAGFAATWLLLQTLLAAGRAGGTLLLALVAGATAATGLTLALLAAAAFRLAGAALLGRPRGARAGAATEPARRVRLAMAALAAATLAIGVAPSLLLAVIQPATQLLTGAAAEGASFWSLAAVTDAPGYAAPALTVLLAIMLGLAAWAGRAPSHASPPSWHGGLPEPGPAHTIPPKLTLWPGARSQGRDLARQARQALTPNAGLFVLALALAAVLGWAAR